MTSTFPCRLAHEENTGQKASQELMPCNLCCPPSIHNVPTFTARCVLIRRSPDSDTVIYIQSMDTYMTDSTGNVHIVFGPQGAGKSTYSRNLATEHKAVHFSIDEWMHKMYGPDLPQPLDFGWVMERVKRSESLIWSMASRVAHAGGDVVLDLGFMRVESRTEFVELVHSCALSSQLHFIDAPHDTRRARVLARNTQKGDTFSFEVTPSMFDFMEQQFQQPTDAELATASISTSE